MGEIISRDDADIQVCAATINQAIDELGKGALKRELVTALRCRLPPAMARTCPATPAMAAKLFSPLSAE